MARALAPPPKFLVQSWVDEFNRKHRTDLKILLLPVAHPRLNPIEDMWNDLKTNLRKENHDCTLSRLRDHVVHHQRLQTKEQWNNCFRKKTLPEAESYMIADEIDFGPDNESSEEENPDSTS